MSHQDNETRTAPTPGFIFTTRLTEFICGLTTVATLAYAADGHKKLWDDIPNWILYGLVLSSVSSVVSFVFILERNVKYPIVEAVSSSILSVAYVVYTIFGAINTDPFLDCESLPGREKAICATPKAAEFFTFVNMFAYAFSAGTAIRVYMNRRYKRNDGIETENFATTEEKKTVVRTVDV